MGLDLTMSINFPGGSEIKAPVCNAGDLGSIPGSGRFPGEQNGNPLHEESHGQRSLVGYSPWGHKELDMTEQLHSLTHNVGEPDSIPGWQRSSGEGNGNPLQYPCLENPMGGAW